MAVSPLFLIPGPGMIVVGIVAILFWRRRTSAGWVFFIFGVIAWIVTVAAKFAFAYLANRPVHDSVERLLPAGIGDPLYWLYIGLLTGVFEVGLTAVLVAKTIVKNAGYAEAVAFGAGFGAVEALLLGFQGFIAGLKRVRTMFSTLVQKPLTTA